MTQQNTAYSLALYEKAIPGGFSFDEMLACAHESGFDRLEISIDETDARLSRLDWTAAQKQALVHSIRLSGVPIRTMCLSGHRKYPFGAHEASVREKSLAIMKKAVAFSAEVGVSVIQLAGYDVYYESGDDASRAWFLENLQKAVEFAASAGVVLAFETMETPFMDTVEKSMYYVEKIKSPYLGVYPDIGNLKNASLLYGKSVNEDLQSGQGHLFAAHLKETIPDHYREIPFGTGHTEYTENIEKLKELGVCMFVGEFWYTGNKEWKNDVKDAALFLRNKLDPVFEEVTA